VEQEARLQTPAQPVQAARPAQAALKPSVAMVPVARARAEAARVVAFRAAARLALAEVAQ